MKTFIKRLALAIAATVISASALKAQDIITMRDYSTVKATVSEITDEFVVYKRDDLQDGPVFKAKTSDVVSIEFANGTQQYFNANGKPVATREEALKPMEATAGYSSPYLPQYQPSAAAATLRYSNKRLFFHDSQGRILREFGPEDVADPQLYSKYSGYSLMATAGEWCWCFGLGWLAGSLLGIALAPENSMTDGQMAALVLPGTLIPLAIGIPLDVIGTRNVKKIGDEYNSRYTASVNFGSTRYGIGLALNF